ncbi:MAG: DUF885 domain-containing protein [Clostridiales Family XIII bacterium]|jgi:uncharacterized protein (DUF885 family)|nr:DUF885 domain-containing protein [Clostridiales Family XIII bacterium]
MYHFKTNRHTKVIALVVTLLLFTASASGCSLLTDYLLNSLNPGNLPSDSLTPSGVDEAESAAFSEFTDMLFLHYVSSDAITINYLLAHPENYGIDKSSVTGYGDYDIDAFQDDLDYSRDRLKELRKFDYEKLTYEQQLSYDILYEVLQSDAKSADFIYYGDILSPTIGFQVELPILLAEFHFYDRTDIDIYNSLLEALPGYFDQILAFEEEKKAQGTFMAAKTAADVIAQITEFIRVPDENLLLHVFDEKVDAFDGLTEAERTELKDRNRVSVLEAVIPAFQNLADGLAALNAVNKRTGGLSSLKDGKAYYELLVRSSTGSGRTVEELDKLIGDTLAGCMNEIYMAYRKNPAIFDNLEDLPYPESEPTAILDYLRGAIDKEFPALIGGDYELKYVDKSLEEFSSPAFYLTPAIDDTSHNAIYINAGTSSTTDLFPTLAHEGYPGHLYQSVYFKNLNPEPIRDLLNFSGYTEGWATYVEHRSYALAGFDRELAAMLSANDLATLCMYAEVDIGVNYNGWDVDDVDIYLEDFGISDIEVAAEMYDAMVAEPANYLKYTVGCIEIEKLRKTAEDAFGSDFSAKDFHRFMLETGPAWFDVIEDRLDLLIEAGSLAPAA